MPSITDISYSDSFDNEEEEISINLRVLPVVDEETIYNVLFKDELDSK